MDILSYNENAWNHEVKKGNPWTKPVSKKMIEEARKGKWEVVLTPIKPVPRKWFGEISGKKILCLASGGGQQAPIFAAAGADVTLLDNSPSQLAQDEMVAKRENLSIKLIHGDMRDLSRFQKETFDLIFHPVSNLFVDKIRPVWLESYRVLKKRGTLLSGFCNPVSFIFDYDVWENHKKLEVKYSIPYSDLEQLPEEQLEQFIKTNEPLSFAHTLEDQIGGQIDAGFAITGFYEDNHGDGFLDSHISTFGATQALK